MSIITRLSKDRGYGDMGWLQSYHSFSFAHYFDSRHMGFRSLRVINDDVIAPGGGFPTHGHRDMEIVTYVISGSLAHQDSTGGAGQLVPGDVQAMSAGAGIRHSEFNPSSTEALRLLQIWILPTRPGAEPRYAQTHFAPETRSNQLRLIAAGDSTNGALTIDQDARVYASLLSKDSVIETPLAQGRGAWVQVALGTILVNGTPLTEGDAAAIEGEDQVTIRALEDAEFLLFDLA